MNEIVVGYSSYRCQRSYQRSLNFFYLNSDHLLKLTTSGYFTFLHIQSSCCRINSPLQIQTGLFFKQYTYSELSSRKHFHFHTFFSRYVQHMSKQPSISSHSFQLINDKNNMQRRSQQLYSESGFTGDIRQGGWISWIREETMVMI